MTKIQSEKRKLGKTENNWLWIYEIWNEKQAKTQLRLNACHAWDHQNVFSRAFANEQNKIIWILIIIYFNFNYSIWIHIVRWKSKGCQAQKLTFYFIIINRRSGSNGNVNRFLF